MIACSSELWRCDSACTACTSCLYMPSTCVERGGQAAARVIGFVEVCVCGGGVGGSDNRDAGACRVGEEDQPVFCHQLLT